MHHPFPQPSPPPHTSNRSKILERERYIYICIYTHRKREREIGGGKGKSVMARSADRVGDKSKLDNILLRFRPIAPKPAGDGSPSVKSTHESGRVKRKYVRVRKKRECNKKKKGPPPAGDKDHLDDQYKSSVVTLQLLPERSDGEDLLSGGSWNNLDRKGNNTQMFDEDPHRHFWLSSDHRYFTSATYRTASGESDVQLTAVMAPARVVESRVTVECVTDACMDGGGLGLTAGDIIKNLEVDTCPGFVSDGLNLVKWVNEAYKKMVSQEKDRSRGSEEEEEFRVRLVMKERFPYNYYFSPAFACRVRLEYAWDERKKCSRTVPCDVWRMDGGDFAWRLDVKAALSLSI